MKNKFSLVIKALMISISLLAFSNSNVYSQGWTVQNSGTFENLNSVSFIDQNTGWAVGNAGVVLKTANGGTNWFSLNTGLFNNNTYVLFVNESTGFITTNNSRIIQTSNGGTNWAVITPGVAGITYGVSIRFNSPTQGHILWQNSDITSTTNAGQTWTVTNPGISLYANTEFFLNSQSGWYTLTVLNNSTSVVQTTNAGSNWYSISTVNNLITNSITFATSSIGFIAGDNGAIYKSTNSGVNWSSLSSGTTQKLNNIHSFDINKVLTVGNTGTIMYTINGGTNWTQQISNTTNDLKQVYFINSTTGYAVGTTGTILKTTTGGVGIIRLESSVPEKYSLSQNYPNPFNPTTTVRFDLSKNSHTKLTIYDITGKVVDVLINSELQSGAYEITWDATNYSSGVYFYRIETSGFVDMKRMVLVK